jgi:organic radical activating enzyme
MHNISRLDIMVAYSCNISCQGCISISDQKRNGVESFENIVSYLDQWKFLIRPSVTAVFGGEPCLHPKLLEIIKHVRQTWPTTTIRLITNGYLLDNFDPEEWFLVGPLEIQVSIHRKDHETVINNKIKKILQCRKPWTVEICKQADHHKQIQWSYQHIKIYKSIFKEFIVPYRVYDNNLVPWNSDPTKAHSICGSPSTPILYKGRLYKCPAVANAIDITGKNWYNYKSVGPEDELEYFVKNIGVPESVCGQCPELSNAVVIDHFDIKNVTVKQKNIS